MNAADRQAASINEIRVTKPVLFWVSPIALKYAHEVGIQPEAHPTPIQMDAFRLVNPETCFVQFLKLSSIAWNHLPYEPSAMKLGLPAIKQ